ncbi:MULTISPECIES: hypothetical protein [Sorangium]|uniref:Uncharacterized protein n=1 Tax=Sorangium cellulosum TaxID=56 RepID=A0A4P2QFA2_SORCE|nr:MULTISPECIES: hypothetical protein [Sorangium]AUX28459.1 hypothetical protein SOCE836_005290 [Sorangium cellulosum]WCQ87851.1 hypothetical protein NQZ70_00515 [Sorangium sp. Soce836]
MRMSRLVLPGMLLIAGCEQDPIVITGPCTQEEIDLGYCDVPDAGTASTGGDGGDAGAGGQGGAGGDTHSSLCSGQCAPPAPLGWFGPALLWFGPPDAVPDCPADAPTLGYEGFADLQQPPLECATCACDPPEASCTLSTDWAATSSPSCPGDEPGTVTTSFAAPDGWDGACTAANAIPADHLCNGEPCVQSLTIAAPSVVTTAACTPRLDVPPPVPRLDPWATRARACLAGAYTACDDATTCVPSAPSGFTTCVFHEGDDADCPEGYAVRHLFFADVIDGRDCTPCGCGDPTGASCSLMASVYRDAACTDLLASNVVSSSVPFCVVTPPGVALGSKSAVIVAVEPGACAPHGGEPIGELRPSAPSTFCCIA